MKSTALALLLLPFIASCVSGAPELTADQQSRLGRISLFKPGENPPGQYRTVASITAADCSGAPAGGRVWGNAEKAAATLKEKAAALNADAVVNVRCEAAPLVNNCWAAQKCSGDAVVLQ